MYFKEETCPMRPSENILPAVTSIIYKTLAGLRPLPGACPASVRVSGLYTRPIMLVWPFGTVSTPHIGGGGVPMYVGGVHVCQGVPCTRPPWGPWARMVRVSGGRVHVTLLILLCLQRAVYTSLYSFRSVWHVSYP